MGGSSRGRVLFGSGVVLLALGVLVQFALVPASARFPDDVDTERRYEGELALMLNADALATLDLENVFIRNVPVTIDRRIQTLEVDGNNALVSDVSIVNGPAGPLLQSDDTYAIDRKSMESIENFFDDERVIEREGLVVGFPIGTESADYVGWNGDALVPAPIVFQGEAARGGVDTLAFTAAGGPDVIADPEVLAQFPPALPKAVIEGLVPALGLSDEAAAQFAGILPSLPDPVPLTYTYSYDTSYWVEPDSGVLVDYAKQESRSVAIDLGGQLAPISEVMNLSYAQTSDSVAAAVADAEDAQSTLFWLATVLPLVLFIGGVVAALVGLLMMNNRHSQRRDLTTQQVQESRMPSRS